MTNSPPPKRKRWRTHIVPVAILVGAVTSVVTAVPACEDDPGDRSYPPDVSARAFDMSQKLDFDHPSDSGGTD